MTEKKAPKKRLTARDRLEALKRGELAVPVRLAREGVGQLTPGKAPKVNRKMPNHHRAPSRVGKRGRRKEELDEDLAKIRAIKRTAAEQEAARKAAFAMEVAIVLAIEDVEFDMGRGMLLGTAVIAAADKHGVDSVVLLDRVEALHEEA